MKEINNKYSIDKFQIHKLNSKISALDIDTSFVIYFDCTGNNDVLNSYINDNYKIIKSELSRVSKNFIQLRETKFTEDLRELIKFYVPYLSSNLFFGLSILKEIKRKNKELSITVLKLMI